jgi:hypothetical protein
MTFKKDASLATKKYASLIREDKDLVDIVNINNIIVSAFGESRDDILKSAFHMREKFALENANDYYHLVLKALITNSKMNKKAYPMMQGALSEDPSEEYDLDKWADLVHKVFDAVSKKHMSFNNALDYYSGYLDTKSGEDFKFKQWVNYYRNAENLKYSNLSENEMKKEGLYQFPLMGGGTYPSELGPKIQEEKHRFESAKEKSSSKQDYEEWKAKLYAAIRRIDKLLRQSDQYLKTDSHEELADLLHQFDMQVRRIQLETTASDLAIRTADKFNKLGFLEGSDILTKFAQQAPPADQPVEPEEIKPEEFSTEDEPVAQTDAVPATTDVGEQQPEQSDVQPTQQEKNEEYSALAGDITIEVATSKLEEVAGFLSDRRVIRLLAEFDIMLDKIGIAAMFPELAESQSKLIDSYSYALTRVTKMLGMLSSGRSLADIANAKSNEMQSNVQKEVNKTFNATAPVPTGGAATAPGKPEKGTDALQEGFGPETEQEPAPTPQTPQPAPTAKV